MNDFLSPNIGELLFIECLEKVPGFINVIHAPLGWSSDYLGEVNSIYEKRDYIPPT